MAITEAFAFSNTVSTTEFDLCNNSTTISSQTTDGIYQAFIDFSNLTATESYQLKIYEKVQSSGTQRLIDNMTISGVQTEPVYATAALLLMHGWTYTLTKLQGTDRAIAWSIRQVA
jgi:hypothetical protein